MEEEKEEEVEDEEDEGVFSMTPPPEWSTRPRQPAPPHGSPAATDPAPSHSHVCHFHRPQRRPAIPSPGPSLRPRRGHHRGRGAGATARYRARTSRGLRPLEAVPHARDLAVHGAPTSAQWRGQQCVHVHYECTGGECPERGGGCRECKQMRNQRTVRGHSGGRQGTGRGTVPGLTCSHRSAGAPCMADSASISSCRAVTSVITGDMALTRGRRTDAGLPRCNHTS
jgi:hypothetical protein